MKFQTKIVLLFIPVTIASISAALLLVESEADSLMEYQYRAKALSIAASAAAVIDGEAHRAVQKGEVDSPAYQTIRRQLQLLRIANRRDDTWVQNLYTVYPAPGQSELQLIGVSPEDSLELGARPGEPWRVRSKELPDWEHPWVSSQFVEDQFGRWVIATAPIRDHASARSGSVVAAIPAYRLERRQTLMRDSALSGLGVGALLALIASLVISRAATKPLLQIQGAVDRIAQGDLTVTLPEFRKDEFGSVNRAVNTMVRGLRERETVKSAFARYVSHQVMEKVLNSGALPTVQGERRRVTILFSDIRGFTSLSEKLSPEAVVALLNEYFDKMVEIIFKHGGTLDKYMGDGIMVIFGAPAEDPYQEEHAVRAALEMQHEVAALSARWLKEYSVDVRIGVGINTGTAIVGNIGSSKRLEYTAIGDTVNLASRLEAATKEHHVGILLSEYTQQGIRGTIATSRVGAIAVRGKADPVTVYSLSP